MTINSIDSDKWLEAMKEEIELINKNNVWELTDLPKDRKAISCKWIFRRKFKVDSSLETYKVRLVGKGYTQQPGVDFVDTYSPVTKFTSVRIIMPIVVRWIWNYIS